MEMEITDIPILRREVSHTEKGWKEDLPVNQLTVTEDSPARTSSVILGEIKIGRTNEDNAGTLQ